MKKKALALVFTAASFLAAGIFPQDFGFGAIESGGDSSSVPASVSDSAFKINGKVSAELKLFFDECSEPEKIKNIHPGNIFSANLDFSASTRAAEAFIGLELSPVFDGSSSPVNLGEAYARAYLGNLTLEAGIRKLSWGKADSFGPLDVINPIDYSDLSLLSDPHAVKIPRPMLHGSWALGSFSKLEAVFVPWFQGHSFALTGRWAPSQISGLGSALVSGLGSGLSGHPSYPLIADAFNTWLSEYDVGDYYRDHDYTLRSAQAGLRFTTTIGPSDLGFQYYFGRLPRPAYDVNYDDFVDSLFTAPYTIDPSLIEISMGYNYFHQIGVDFAMVIAGFNTRAELGSNITKDLDGKDGSVYNPALVYSLGFDRDIILGINLNLQGNGSVMFFHGNIGEESFDIETGKELSSTRITAIVSRKFMRDELELKATALWGIEDRDFMLRPSVAWSANGLGAELCAGFFGGREKGELGQYADNNYMRIIFSYSF